MVSSIFSFREIYMLYYETILINFQNGGKNMKNTKNLNEGIIKQKDDSQNSNVVKGNEYNSINKIDEILKQRKD